MYSIPGHSARNCEGLSRREWLRVGGLGTLGLGLPELLRSQQAHAELSESNAAVHLPSFGRAKHCIVLFMFGAPAHQDTWDMKPEASADVRGEFQPIDSCVPGISVSEHIPLLAGMTDRFAQIRSLTHPDNTHTVAMHYMLTGTRHRRPKTNPQNAADDTPCFGAAMNYLTSRGLVGEPQLQSPSALPTAVSLNAPANQVSANNHIFPGFFAGFLGQQFDPLFVSQHPNDDAFQPLPKVASVDRLARQRELLSRLESDVARLPASATESIAGYYEQAFELLTSSSARRAFRIQDEPAKLRERYGSTPFGQGCLLARRLIEAGVSLVTVNWERDDAYWDTHADNFNKHKKQLLPNMDQGVSALLNDLEDRGVLDETLIVWMGEFGRTPKINGNAGRDHWAACNTVLLAGAGVPGGTVYGASDRDAAYPTLNPTTPDDLAATIYHLLGINHHQLIRTAVGQPVPLSQGEPVTALL